MLWDVCDDEIIGKIVNRQGTSKEQSEINDIEKALNALADHKIMPLFVATSNMVMQTPHEETTNTQPALKDIEETMDIVLKKRNDQLDKKYDKAISKSEQGNKKMDDVIKRLESLEHNVVQKNIMLSNNQATIVNPHDQVPSSTF